MVPRGFVGIFARYGLYENWFLEILSPVSLIKPAEEGRQALLDMALDRSVARSDVTPTVDSEILTLSTCTGVGHATRWIVQGVPRAEEAPETGEETAEPES